MRMGGLGGAKASQVPAARPWLGCMLGCAGMYCTWWDKDQAAASAGAIRSVRPQVLTCISLAAAHGMLGQHIVLLREGGIRCHQDTPCQPAKLRA